MKVVRIVISTILVVWLPLFVLSQTRTEIDETYRNANSYFYFEDYEEALALYQKIYHLQPDNYNLNFRIGFCYLNIPGNKHKAIQYLEKAVQSTTSWFNEESITEQRAPIDAYFYLGNAYLASNRIDDALGAYNKFYNLTKGKGRWDFDFFNHQVNVAKNSLKIQRNPVDFIMANMGNKINDRFPNFNAVVSGNGKVLAFTTKLKFYNAINIARKNETNQWEKPVNITLDLQTDISCSTLSLSDDGNELYLFRDDNQDGNIYVTRYNGTKWTPIKKLNPNVNTEAYETHASLSPDGKQMYFTSNRKGGYGGLDIWVSTRTSNDDWGPARNLGPTINTPYNENTPFITTDGTSLYFSSEGHDNMGGYDIFVSQQTGNRKWSTPVNLGFPVNTTDDDLFFHPVGDGASALIARFDNESSFGETDIFEVELFIPKFRKSIVPKTIAPERISDKSFNWLVVDTLSAKGIATVNPEIANTIIDITSNNPMKLYMKGKAYSIVAAGVEGIAEDVNTSNTDVMVDGDAYKPIQLQETNTTNETLTISKLKPYFKDSTPKTQWPSDSPTIKQRELELNNLNNPDDTFLSEILLLLTPTDKHKYILPILKKKWEFGNENFNETVVHFATSFRNEEELNTITFSLTALYDRIEEFNLESLKPNRQNLAKQSRTSIIKAYNELINKSTEQLGNDLAVVMLKNKDVNSLTQLIEQYQKQNPDGFKRNQEELLLLLSRMAISRYISLPDDQKLALYNGYSGETTTGTFSQWFWVVLLLMVIAAGLILGIRYYKAIKK